MSNLGGYNGRLMACDGTMSCGKMRLSNLTPGTDVACNSNRELVSGGGGTPLTDGQLQIGKTGADPVAANITAGTNITITNGPGSIKIDSTFGSGVLAIANGGTNSSTALANGALMVSSGGKIVEGTSSSTPSFVSMLISGLTASMPVKTDGSKILTSSAIGLTNDVTGVLPVANGGTNSSTALSNGNIMVSSGGKIVEGTSSSAPSFTSATISGLTASMPVKTDGSKGLTSSAISLTTDITGVLPIANGGTNSSTALANSCLMVSSGGKIVEGTSSSAPSFTSMGLAGDITFDNTAARTIKMGSSAVGSHNNLNITGSATTSVQGGSIVITGGASSSSNGGDVTINGGIGSGGINGSINLGSSANTTAIRTDILFQSLYKTNATSAGGGAIATQGGIYAEKDIWSVNLGATSLTASMPVKSDANKFLVSSAISLTSDISGILPIANGGTNSSTSLGNGKIMVSSGGQIVEGTSSTTPAFTSLTLQTSGGTPTSLDFFEIKTVSFTWTASGGSCSPNTSNITIHRIGKLVTLYFDSFSTTQSTAVTGNYHDNNGDIPTRFRPASITQQFNVVLVVSGSASTAAGDVYIDTSGNITIQRDPAESAKWPTGANQGWTAFTVTYLTS